MKIAKPNTICIQTEPKAIINNYALVEDDYDFMANDCEDVTTEDLLEIIKPNELTTMEHWDRHGLETLQYQQVRNIIWGLLIAEIGLGFAGWASLSSDRKMIAARWGLASYALRLTHLSEEEDIYYFKILIEETAGTRRETMFGRKRVIEEMRQVVGLEYFRKEIISKADIDDLYASIKGTGYVDDYIESNSPIFKNWLTNAVGTEFESNGFAQKSYYHAELVTKLMLIYNGAY